MKLSKWVIAIPLSFFLFLSVLFTGSSEKSSKEGENVFSSSTYIDYREQLKRYLTHHPSFEYVQKTHLKDPFQLFLKEIITQLELPLEDTNSRRHSHEVFVKHLRVLASQRLLGSIHDQESEKFVDDLIRWLFLKADIGGSMEQFLYTFLPEPKGADFVAYVPAALQLLRENPKFQESNELPPENGYLRGNLPSIQFRRGNTEVIRLGVPLTIPSFPKSLFIAPEIDPEFLLFTRLQQGHFYVNLMRRKGAEEALSKAMERLEEENPFFYIITLDKNSSFYRQEEDYPDHMDAQSFKEMFLERLTEKNGNYFWSSHLDPIAFKQDLTVILDKVEGQFFHSSFLNREERQDFIELTYIEILNHLIKKWDPPSMNITCKHAIDRGPSTSVLLMIADQGVDEKKMAAHLLAPPLLFHGRPSYPSKIGRFVHAAKRYLKKS